MVKYSYYPFDKKEDEIVNALENSDEETETIDDNVTEPEENINNNFVENISIDHDKKLFVSKNKSSINSIANTYQNAIEHMKEKRRSRRTAIP